MVLKIVQYSLCYVRSSLVATRSETGPIIKVNDLDIATLTDDAVTAIDRHTQLGGGTVAHVLESVLTERQALRAAVNDLVTILAVPLIEGVKI